MHFRLAHHSLLKLKKYEGLVYHDEHTVAEIDEITDSTANAKIGKPSMASDKDPQNKTNKTIHFELPARNMVNLATQEKNARTT